MVEQHCCMSLMVKLQSLNFNFNFNFNFRRLAFFFKLGAIRPMARLVVLWPIVVMSFFRPRRYIRNVLTRLSTQRTSEIGDLLPHRWQPT